MARQRRPLACFGLFRQEELMLSARQTGNPGHDGTGLQD